MNRQSIQSAIRPRLQRSVTAAAVTGLCLSVVAPARAENITLSVIGPHEYELPVNFQDFNVLVQYAEYNDENRAWNPAHDTSPGPGGSLYVGLTKYVRFMSFDAIPNVGFAYEVIEPEVVRTQSLDEGRYHGLGDTLTGPAVWFKPSEHSTLGLQSFFQIPDGTRQVTSGAWENLTSIFFDQQWGLFSLTGDAGAVFRGHTHIDNEPSVAQSTALQSNVRVGWKANRHVEPFLAFDWQTSGALHYVNTGEIIPNSNNNEYTVGGGAYFPIADKYSFTVRYSHGVAGSNTTVTDAVYLKFAASWR